MDVLQNERDIYLFEMCVKQNFAIALMQFDVLLISK